MGTKDMLVWGGVAFGVWYLFLRKKEPVAVVKMQEASDPTTEAEKLWASAFQTSNPAYQVLGTASAAGQTCVKAAAPNGTNINWCQLTSDILKWDDNTLLYQAQMS